MSDLRYGDYLDIAVSAVRLFDNDFNEATDLANLTKVMPIILGKSGKDGDSRFTEADLDHLFYYLKTSDVTLRKPVLAMPHGCSFMTDRAECVYHWDLNVGRNTGHVVLYDAAHIDPFRSTAAFNIKW